MLYQAVPTQAHPPATPVTHARLQGDALTKGNVPAAKLILKTKT